MTSLELNFEFIHWPLSMTSLKLANHFFLRTEMRLGDGPHLPELPFLANVFDAIHPSDNATLLSVLLLSQRCTKSSAKGPRPEILRFRMKQSTSSALVFYHVGPMPPKQQTPRYSLLSKIVAQQR
jgi:hypothetical protein